MKFLRILRHQFAGHATAKSASGLKPGELLSGELLGRALRETGLTKFPEFTKRLRDEIAAQLEGFIAQMRQKFPAVDEFVRGGYALDVEKGQLGR